MPCNGCTRTLPPHQLSSQPAWHYTPRQLGRASKPGKAATAGTSFLAVPDKARRARRQRIKCVCPTVPGDRLDHCITLQLLYATVAAPLTIKGGPRRTERGFRFFGPSRFVASPRIADKHEPAGVGYYASLAARTWIIPPALIF